MTVRQWVKLKLTKMMFLILTTAKLTKILRLTKMLKMIHASVKIDCLLMLEFQVVLMKG